jgi:CubicO group peptidase (beta-lactamase class C family)
MPNHPKIKSQATLSRRTALAAPLAAVTGAGVVALTPPALAKWDPRIKTKPQASALAQAARVQGLCQDRFRKVWQIFEQSLASGDDIGASFCVFIDGEPVIDIWGGYFDAKFDRPWTRDTIITTHSTTKTMTAMAALKLADMGELDFNAPVSKYWPEFAANGKSRIEVRQLLGHTSGLAGWTDDVTWADIYDLERSSALLARQEPWWEPGTASGYHGVTQGHLVSGVISRITGLTLGQFFDRHIAKPLNADYHIGTGPEHDHRVAPFVQAIPEDGLTGNAMLDRVAMNPNLSPANSNTIAWRRAEIGAANGNGNARGVATIHATLACGSANGIRILSDKGRQRVLEMQSNGIDVLLGVPLKWGMGFCLESQLFPNPRRHKVAYWCGNGGSLGFVDLDARMSVAFVMNRWIERMPYEHIRRARLLDAVYEGLDGAKG